jgi:hypothetical protein
MKLASGFVALALGLSAANAQAQRISIYGDLTGVACNLAIPPGTAGTFHVMASLGGLASGGITGAEFRIDGALPHQAPGWFMTASPDISSSVTLGNPLTTPGTNIAFPTCQTGSENGLVHLFTIQAFNSSDPESHVLRIRARNPPTNSNFDCPLVVLCDAPVYTTVCVNGGFFLLNSGPVLITAPHSPQPPDGATDVSTNTDLHWTNGDFLTCILGIPCQAVYFGTEPDPPLVWSNFCHDGFIDTYDPGSLAPGTTYYWRVAQSFGSQTASSPIWSFHTGTTVAAQPAAWSAVKAMYR